MKGSYFLIILVERAKNVKTKRRIFSLQRGYYVYVGSAMNSLEKRVARHFRKDKKLHWHIDFLLKEADLLEAYLIPSEERLEERLSREVGRFARGVEGFGASDLQGVHTNLYYFGEANPEKKLENILSNLGLRWKRVKSEGDIMET
ncbi:GIY-YIG nuclease family protein [Palaeococcus sp. (in: euryarchaeotes)]